MNYKMLKVYESTHRGIKCQAAEKGQTIRDFLDFLIWKNEAGVELDVTKVETSMLNAIFDDITNEMNRRYETMSREEIDNYLDSLDNIPFWE